MKNVVELREFRSATSAALAKLSCLLLLAALSTASAHSQKKSAARSSETPEPPILAPGKPVENSLSGGASYSYRMAAEEGQFLHASVEQFGIHVSLTFYDPDRKAIASMEIPNGTAGRQQISAIARTKGVYTLTLASPDQTATPGRCSVSLEEMHAPSSEDRARISAEQAFMSAGKIYLQAAENSSTHAAQEYERALSLWRTAGDTYEESVTLNVLGNLYLYVGENAKALDAFNQALPLTRALGDHKGEAAARQNIGAVYYANGEKEKALDQFTATLAFERDTGQPALQAQTLSYLGEVSSDLGQEDAALTDFEEALTMVRQVGDQSETASVLTSLGKVHDDLGEKQKALDDYAQALSLERALSDAAGGSVTLSNIGMVYDSLGDRKAALDNYGQALKLERQMRALDAEAKTFNNMASVYDELGQERRALDFYNRALSLWRRLKDSTGEAMTLVNIGFAYHNHGQDRKALTYYNQALPVLHNADDRAAEAMALHNIGVSEDRIGNRQDALARLNEGLFIFFQLQDPLDVGLTLGDLMSHSRDTGNPGAAIFFGKEAVNSYQQVRKNLTGLPQNLQRSFVASKEGTYRQLADLLITEGRLSEAEQVLDLLKEEEYLKFLRRGNEKPDSPTEPIGLTRKESAMHERSERDEKSVAAAGRELQILNAIPTDRRSVEQDQRLAELERILADAREEWNEFCHDATLESNLPPGPDNSLKEFAVLTADTLQDLGAGTVALRTLVGEKTYRVILVTSSQKTPAIAGEYSIGREELRRKVFAFRQALQNPARDPKPLAQDLYRILIGPVAGELESAQATTLMLDLDDVLRYIPLAALHDGQEYLAAKYRTAIFTPASIGRLMKRSEVKKWAGLGMGVSEKYGDFDSLPAVPEELHRIIRAENSPDAEGVIPGQTMLDDDFTEDNMKKALKNKFPLVHIASHFSLQPGDETQSFLLLGGPDHDHGQHLSLADLDKDDVSYDLDGTELLTLSACDTAMGGTGDDGFELDGFAMMAQRKGAKAVVATLWSVNDRSTGRFMQQFYRLWTSNPGVVSKAEALRQAQLMMLRGELGTEEIPVSPSPSAKNSQDRNDVERSAHFKSSSSQPSSQSPQYSRPFYWAPFILIGNWR